MLLSVLAIAVAIVSLLLGLAILLRNLKSSFHISFAAFAILLGLWIPANYFGSYLGNNSVRLLFFTDFTIGPLLAYSFCVYGYQAMKYFKGGRKGIHKLVFLSGLSAVVLLSLASASRLVALPVYKNNNILATPQALYYPYIITAAILALVGIVLLSYGSTTADQAHKKQARIVFWGLGVFVVTIVASNIIFPSLKFAQAISYFGILVMLLCMSYSIARYRLFDLRLAVARSLAYLLVVGTLALIYSIGLFGVINALFPGTQHQFLREIASVILVAPLLITFQPIKKFFDRITNKLFFRHGYDSQAVLDNLGESLVAEIDLQKVLHSTRQILANALNTSFIEFMLFEGNKPYLGAASNTAIEAQLEKLSTYIKQQPHDLLIVDEPSIKSEVRDQLIDNNVAVSLRLKTARQLVGYVLFGGKKNGGTYTSQDINLLAIVASELAIAVQNSLRFEEIEKFNITLQEKIEEATKELRHANVRLKELDATKDEFISMASHQLRTPLTTIKGYLSMILDGDVGKIKTDEKELVQHAFDSAERMVYLIADLLNVSRLQSGKFVIDNKPTNLPEVVKGEIQQLKEQAANRGITFNYSEPEDYPMLNLDETKIRQVIMNFLDNALYYTPKDGEVTVELSLTKESVSLTVTDTGVGVPKAMQHHLFTKFYRADNARKMRPDGTGLGLYMAKKVIVAQGGAIMFNSIEGKGSTFGFSFPRASTEIKKQA